MKTCDIDVDKKLNRENETIEELREKIPSPKAEGVLNEQIAMNEKNKTIRRKDSTKIKSIWKSLDDVIKYVTQRKLGYLHETFEIIKDGETENINFSNVQMMIQSLESDKSKTEHEVAQKIKEVYSAHEYDNEGNIIEGKTTELNEKEQGDMDTYYNAAHLLEIAQEDDKKIYGRNKYLESLYNPEETMMAENYKASEEYIKEKNISIEEDVALDMQVYRDKRIETFTSQRKRMVAQELQKKKGNKNKSIKFLERNFSREEIYAIESQAEIDFESSDDLTEKYRKKAKNKAEDKSYTDFIKYEYLPTLWQRINENPRIAEAYKNREKYNSTEFEVLKEAKSDIGKDITYLDKYNNYVRVMVQDLDTGLETKGATHSPFGVDLSSFTHMKGSTHEILNNLKLSDYMFHISMSKNIFVSKAVKEIQKFDIGKEVSEEIQTEMELSKTDLNKRLIEKDANVSRTEIENLEMVTNSFNNRIGIIYEDLKINKENIRKEVYFVNKQGVETKGSMNQEVNSNIEIAIENSKNEISILFSEIMYEDFFNSNRTFNDVKRYFEGKNENLDTDRLIEFSKKVNISVDINIDVAPTLRIVDLAGMKTQLNSTLFERNKKFVGNLIKRHTDNGYVLTDQNGNKVGFNKEMQLGSLSMEGFDVNDPTAFADWIATHLFIDANVNNTISFLKNDKIMILPEPIAKALDEVKLKMGDQKSKKITKMLIKATSLSKLGMLYSPVRASTYNVRNMVYDFYSMLQSQPQAIFTLGRDAYILAKNKFKNPNTVDQDVFTELFNYMRGNKTSNNFEKFLRYSESFMGISEKELKSVLGFKDGISDLNLEEEFKKMQEKVIAKIGIDKGSEKVRSKAVTGVKNAVIGYHYFTKGMKFYMKHVTNASQTREFLLRYAVYKSKMSEYNKMYDETGEVKPANWGAASKKIIRNLLEEGNAIKGDAQENIDARNDMYEKAAIKFSNQSLIDYGDSSKFVDAVSKWGIPFARFPEGAIKQHYNLMHNFVTDMIETIQNDNLSFGQKTLGTSKVLGRGTLQTLNAVGVPVLAWNMAMLALSGMDLDDIPEYYEDDGFVVLPPVTKLMGFENIQLLSNTDGFSDILGIISLNDLNTNIQNALANNWYALSDEDLETDLFNDLSDAILSSFDKPSEMLVVSPIEKVLSMANPLIKTFPELFTGNDYYQEGPVNIGNKYTFGQNVTRKMFSNIGMNSLYTALESINGTPRGMDAYKFFGIKTVGSKLDAWNQQKALAYKYSEEVLGKEPYSSDQRYGDTVDYMRDDITGKIKYGKFEDSQISIIEYYEYMKENTDSIEELESEMKNLQLSLKNRFSVIPSTAISQKDLEGYIATLSQKDINDLKLAYEYQREMLGPFYDWIFGN